MAIEDAEIRGKMIVHLYEFRHRNGGIVPISAEMFGGLGPITDDMISGIGRQLADAGLIEWNGYLSGPVVGSARIRSLGIDAVERGDFTGLKIQFPQQQSSVSENALGTASVVSEAAISETLGLLEKVKAELPSLELSNSSLAEINADVSQIEIEVARPSPRKEFVKLFLTSLRDNLAKAAGAAAAGGLFGLGATVANLLARHFF